MHQVQELAPKTVEQQAAAWVTDFDGAITRQDAVGVAKLFVTDSHWRDLCAFTWDITQRSGEDRIERDLERTLWQVQPRRFRISESHTRPQRISRSGRDVIEVYLDFETAVGFGVAVARLVPDETGAGGLRAWMLLTRLQGLKGFEELPPGTRPKGVGFERSATGEHWLARLERKRAYADRDPEVLVIGGGHSGLFAAAHLDRLGVDTLIIDRLPRVGDNWRTRYSSLALHNKTDMNHFPYMPFPDFFPEYLPKDKLANWFEAYVESLELSYWTSTEFLGGSYDEAAGQWSVTLRFSDGSERVMRPRQIVMATGGVGGTPNIPTLAGIEDFAGRVMHTKRFTGGADHKGKKVLVVGVGTSGHDVAYDLHHNGGRVTMVQRNPTIVVNLESANMSYPHYAPGNRLDEADLTSAAGFVSPVLKSSFTRLTAMTNELDRELLGRLEAAGLRLDNDVDKTGWMLRFYDRAGGYYINVGCSELIADGEIAVRQLADIDRFVTDGARLTDGTVIEADLVVFATGYLNQQTEVRQFFGDEVADRIGQISGFGPDGELQNAWRPTAQPGLRFMVSGIAGARTHASLVALQIKAELEGLSVTNS